MFITPASTTGQEVGRRVGRHFACPGCTVQHTMDHVDTEWVQCPIINMGWLCLGCCMDWGWEARRWRRSNKFDRQLIAEAAKAVDQPIHDMLKMCLDHQLALIDEDYDPSRDAGLRDSVIQAMEYLETEMDR